MTINKFAQRYFQALTLSNQCPVLYCRWEAKFPASTKFIRREVKILTSEFKKSKV